MTEYKPITREESMALSLQEYIARCQAWIDEFNDGKLIKVESFIDCPIHFWIVTNKKTCCHEFVANTAFCKICGKPCCPDCFSHNVHQMSRVTGYVGNVDSWNAGKQQEYADRKRAVTFG